VRTRGEACDGKRRDEVTKPGGARDRGQARAHGEARRGDATSGGVERTQGEARRGLVSRRMLEEWRGDGSS
jgi:hypothetical protein